MQSPTKTRWGRFPGLSPDFALAICAILWLSACAAPNPYRPFEGGLGYSDLQIAERRYQIMFHGAEDQDPLTAKKFAILRAAEIAKRENFPYFRLEEGKTREKEAKSTIRETDTRVDPYGGYGPYPGRYGGRRTHRHTITRTETRPVVKITVDLDSAACEDCLSADDRIREAAVTPRIRS
ncbi:MAG: hypothetical protein ABIW76_05725 [Fibrobacteria bacterium]